MTPEEQQQVNAMRNFYESQIANLSREGANMAVALEDCAQQLKSAKSKIVELTPKTDG